MAGDFRNRASEPAPGPPAVPVFWSFAGLSAKATTGSLVAPRDPAAALLRIYLVRGVGQFPLSPTDVSGWFMGQIEGETGR
jgi:hypothetical protein